MIRIYLLVLLLMLFLVGGTSAQVVTDEAAPVFVDNPGKATFAVEFEME